MPLSGSDSLNKTIDEHTFATLATAVVSRLASVSSSAWTGQEQRLNSMLDEFTVDKMVAHFKARFNASLPGSNIPLGSDRINSTGDRVTLDHVVAYLKNVAGISISVPVNSVAPVISGSGNGPFTVTNNGTWSNSPDSYTYQWKRGASNVSGATTNVLASNAANVGQSITCVVSGVNEAGTGTGVASNAITGA